jgi:hypothetical protein
MVKARFDIREGMVSSNKLNLPASKKKSSTNKLAKKTLRLKQEICIVKKSKNCKLSKASIKDLVIEKR